MALAIASRNRNSLNYYNEIHYNNKNEINIKTKNLQNCNLFNSLFKFKIKILSLLTKNN